TGYLAVAAAPPRGWVDPYPARRRVIPQSRPCVETGPQWRNYTMARKLEAKLNLYYIVGNAENDYSLDLFVYAPSFLSAFNHWKKHFKKNDEEGPDKVAGGEVAIMRLPQATEEGVV